MRDQRIKNPYKVLNIPNFSEDEVIKKSYRNLALTHHPDKGGDENIMKEVNFAYELLTKHKSAIDRAIRRQMQPQPVFEYGFTVRFHGPMWGSNGADSTTAGWYGWEFSGNR